MDGKDAIQEADRLWLLHQLLLPDPTLPPGPCGLGLGQPVLGFRQKKKKNVAGEKKKKQDFG